MDGPEAKSRYGVQHAARWAVDLRLAILHVGTAGIFFVPFDRSLVWLALALFFPRMFGVTAGYHRYFSHRAFKTSRLFQFILALLASSTGQRGILWWAAHHRAHHRHTDREGDVHSPKLRGFWYSHVGWLCDGRNTDTDLDRIPDFARYPELRFLNKYHYFVVYGLLAALYVAGDAGWFGSAVSGLQAAIWGFFLSTAAVLHSALVVNSLCHDAPHLGGTRRYRTEDTSVNVAWLAIPTMGESWHNNHHRYAAASRNGFAWWEIDLTYLLLRLLAALGLVRDLRSVPSEVLAEGRLLPDR